jgi:IS30 family transposase
MRRTGRPGMSNIEKEEVWKRWRTGESFSEIGRAVKKPPGSIFTFLQNYGGIIPLKRKRACSALGISEREEISRGIAGNLSFREIARNMKRSPSTICREVNRHGGRLKYRDLKADERASEFAKRPKACKLKLFSLLQSVVTEKLALKWSPEQISGWLKRIYPQDSTMQVSHETIYRCLFVQFRGVLEKELIKHLRSKRKMRQSKQFNTKGVIRGKIIDRISIRKRPSEAECRIIPGHWEGDLIAVSRNTPLLREAINFVNHYIEKRLKC